MAYNYRRNPYRKQSPAGRGKAGPLARAIHRAADMHAYENPRQRVQPPRTELALAQTLRKIAADMQASVAVKIDNLFRLSNFQEAAVLVQLRKELLKVASDFGQEYEPAFRDAVQNSYGTGKAGARMALWEQAPDTNPKPGVSFVVNFSLPDRAAMEAIASDMFTDLAGQTDKMCAKAVGLLRTTAGRVIAHELAVGKNPRNVARMLEAELVAMGYKPSAALSKFIAAHEATGAVRGLKSFGDITGYMADGGHYSFIDKGGREWDLRDYCEMAAHTKLMIAHNEGTANTMRDAQVAHYMVTNLGAQCDICGDFEGEIFWLGFGDDRGYPMAPTLPPFHPWCRHSIVPLVRLPE